MTTSIQTFQVLDIFFHEELMFNDIYRLNSYFTDLSTGTQLHVYMLSFIFLYLYQMRLKFKYKNSNIKVQTSVPIACFTSGWPQKVSSRPVVLFTTSL